MLIVVLKHGYFPEEISSNMNCVGQQCLLAMAGCMSDTCHISFSVLNLMLTH